MNYDAEIDAEDHGVEWLEHYGEYGGLQLVCEDDVGIVISAGWAHIEVCPMCGAEVEIDTEEV